MSASLKVCGMRGIHTEEDCTQPANHHRKYVGLLRHRPHILWIVGPEAFSGSPDLVFRIRTSSRDIVHLHPTEATQLAAPSV